MTLKKNRVLVTGACGTVGRELIRQLLSKHQVGELIALDNNESELKTYRTHRVNRHLQVWFPENRMYRSDNKMEDGPGKTIWGARQRAWLQQTLLQASTKPRHPFDLPAGRPLPWTLRPGVWIVIYLALASWLLFVWFW